MKAMSQRQERVAEQILEEVARLISRGDFTSDLITPMVNITGVWVSADLRKANVYFTCMDNRVNLNDLRLDLNAERHKFQQALAKLPHKFTPKLAFFIDEDRERSARVDDLIRKTSSFS